MLCNSHQSGGNNDVHNKNSEYGYDSSFGFFESATTPAAKRTIDSKCIIYSTENIPATSIPAFVGFNSNFTTGNSDFNTPEIHTYWQTMYEYITGYESMVQQKNEEIQSSYEAGEQDGYEVGLDQGYDAGYEVGFQDGSDDAYDTAYNKGFLDGKQEGFTNGYNTGLNMGKTECEKTHLALQEQAYGDGYDMGQEMCEKTHANIIDVAYHNGQYDCQQTHETLMRGQYEEGWYDGYEIGDKAGYDRGFPLGHEQGKTVGIQIGLEQAEEATQMQLDKQFRLGKAEGYEIGYTDALNSGDVISGFVDSVFSAPIDFLHTAFNIEILGVNLFNVFMLVLSILIVGLVLLLVFKFR